MTAVWLIIILFGEVVFRTGPIPPKECEDRKAVIVAAIDKRAASGVPVVINERVVTRDDVQVECSTRGNSR